LGNLLPIVVYADKIIGGGKTPKIGHRFKAWLAWLLPHIALQ
jgi:hypothetical protein